MVIIRVKKLAKFKKFTPIEKGIENLTNWYKKIKNIKEF